MTARKIPITLEGVVYWRCGTCLTYKPEASYYLDGKTASGISSACRLCHGECAMRTRDTEKKRARNTEHMRRARVADPERFRARERDYSKRRRTLSPEKVRARNLLNNAVKRGCLVKASICQICASGGKISGHHEDYTKPLDVVWLCAGCHGKKHRVTADE